jgi:ABC-2 type transport system ATP-binding protein
VLVSSHLLSEIEVTCDRAAFVKHGAVVKTVDLDAPGPVVLRATVRNVGPKLGFDGFATVERFEGDQLTLRACDEASIPEVARRLAAQCDLHSLTPERMSLEEMFLEVIGPEAGL